MNQHAPLNNIEHQHLKIITERGAQYGDNIMFSVVYPIEFRNLQAHYPIAFLSRDEHTLPIALFGFEENENLFLNSRGWDTSYIPLSVERHPFLIGLATNEHGEEQLMVHIDMESPRVNTEKGEALFLPQGGNSPLTEKMASILATIHDGQQYNHDFVSTLKSMQLLEDFTFDAPLKDGSNVRIAGLQTIDEDKLNSLNSDQVNELHKKGYLQAIYMQLASFVNFRALITRKNQQLEN